MPVNVRLLRKELIRELARLKRLKWNRLPYPNFVVQAESEINPDYTNEPDVNFSEAEAIGGFITPIPIRHRTPSTDIKTYISDFNKPDRYHIQFFKNQRLRWNQHPVNHVSMIYCFPHTVIEVSRRRERQVVHTYLQTLRGKDRVNQLGRHLRNGIDGLEETYDRIQASANIKTVDDRIDEILRENRHIQNGGP